ncbi:hypothetical protein [Vibrio zhanjiangensis]|nr:hypothetical protein [Vibrio zhanjiangensis]
MRVNVCSMHGIHSDEHRAFYRAALLANSLEVTVSAQTFDGALY